MSVNDLAKRWRSMTTDGAPGSGRFSVCAVELEEAARTAWHPVSEPPTDADGDMRGEVIAYHPEVGMGKLEVKEVARKTSKRLVWARSNDVVLMPPQGGE